MQTQRPTKLAPVKERVRKETDMGFVSRHSEQVEVPTRGRRKSVTFSNDVVYRDTTTPPRDVEEDIQNGSSEDDQFSGIHRWMGGVANERAIESPVIEIPPSPMSHLSVEQGNTLHLAPSWGKNLHGAYTPMEISRMPSMKDLSSNSEAESDPLSKSSIEDETEVQRKGKLGKFKGEHREASTVVDNKKTRTEETSKKESKSSSKFQKQDSEIDQLRKSLEHLNSKIEVDFLATGRPRKI